MAVRAAAPMDNNAAAAEISDFHRTLNHEPFKQRFPVSKHIIFHRTPGLIRRHIFYFIRFRQAGSDRFCTNPTCIFHPLRLLLGRLHRASYHLPLRADRMSEYQGMGHRHLPRNRNFTCLIKLTVKQTLDNASDTAPACSACLFPFPEYFAGEQFAHPF